MSFRSLRPILYTESLDDSIRFYTETLGFSLGERNDDWGWAALSRDAVEIMLACPNAHTPFAGPQFTGSFYIDTDDVDTCWAALRDKAEVVYEPETFDWGMREFGIRDNNGYLLQFGQQAG